MATVRHKTATESDQITVEVYRDEQDPANRGWAYRQYDGHPGIPRSDWVLVESGPIQGRQTSVRPSVRRVLTSAEIQPSLYVYVQYR